MANPATKVKPSGYPRKKPRSGSPVTQSASLRIGGGSNAVAKFVTPNSTSPGRTFRGFAPKRMPSR